MKKEFILKKIKQQNNFLKSSGVKRIALFGSFVKNKQNKKSDIDLLVSFRDKDYGDQYFQVLFHLQDLFKRKIDLIPEECLRKELNYVKKQAEYVAI